MTVAANTTLLFTLPLELREQIYKEVLVSPARSFDLLRTCREINAGARKFLYERPLNFRSQSCLYDWLSKTVPEDCVRVTEISLLLQDVDLNTLLTPELATSIPSSPPRLLTKDLYDSELSKLRTALRRLPRIETLTLWISDRQSFLYRAFIAKVLGLLSSVYPALKDLRIDGSMAHQSLEFLDGFKSLHHFTFSGVSACTIPETARILSRLKRLESLSYHQNQHVKIPLGTPYMGLKKRANPGTIGTAKIKDWVDAPLPPKKIPLSSRPSSLTAELLDTLRNHETLKKVSIFYAQDSYDEILIALREILDQATITSLVLEWPGLQPNTPRHFNLLNHVDTLRIKIKSAVDAAGVMHHLWTRRSQGDLAKLRRLVLTLGNGDISKENLSERKGDASGCSIGSNHLVSIQFS